MSETPRVGDEHDPVDVALDALRRSYGLGHPPAALEGRIVERTRKTGQRRRSPVVVPWLGPRWPGGPRTSARVAWTALAAAAVVAVLAIGLAFVSGPSPLPTAVSPLGGSPSVSPAPPTPTATAAQISPTPRPVGTCPVTAITRVVGGTAPEVDASGLRWRWGGVPWVAGEPEKVVWLADTGRPAATDLVLLGLRLDRSIAADGVAVTYPGAGDHSILAAGAGGVQDVVLPGPGCWLLTATWPGGASSVVVVVSPAAPGSDGPASAAPSQAPVASAVPAVPPVSCPANPRSATPGTGWDNPDYTDGAFRWLTPAMATWLIGGDGDKLVLYSGVGWDVGHMAIEALPVVGPSAVGWLGRTAVEGDIPPGFGGGTLGFGLTLPSRGCWAIAYAGSQATSTIVVDLGR